MLTDPTSTSRRAHGDSCFAAVPLDAETRPAVCTASAAYYLNRRPQTMRIWACRESGPIRPIRINGRLAWPVADIRRLLGVSSPTSAEAA